MATWNKGQRFNPRATAPVVLLFAALGATAALLLGCQGESANEPSAAAISDNLEAQRVADAMLAAYRGAPSYTDTAFYVQRSILRGEGVERETPWFQMSLQFDRPNRLTLKFQEVGGVGQDVEAYQIANDGTVTHSALPGYPDQVHEAESPERITVDNFMPAEKMRDVLLMDSLGDMFPQLAMLLNVDDAEQAFPHDSDPRLIEPGELRGRPCYRLATKHPAGQRVLWIDQVDYRLHRMELPIEGQEDLLNPDGKYLQLAIFIDIEQSAFDVEIPPSEFRLETAEGVHRVSRLVDPAPPPPPESLGRAVSSVELAAPDKSTVSLENFQDVTTVLEFWKIDCAPCRAQTPFIQQAADHFASRDDVAFRAVSIDSPLTPDDRVVATWKKWGSSIPVLRDRTGDSFATLDVRMTPTLVIVGPDQRVQHIEIGAHTSAKPLIEKVEAVARGEDLAAQAQAEYVAALKQRQAELEKATIR